LFDVNQYILSKFPGISPNAAGKIHTYCPFHDDKHPSFSINLDKGGVFICGSRGCGVKGGFPLFYKLMENVSWAEVYKVLGAPAVTKNLELELDEGPIRYEKPEKIDPFPNPPFANPVAVAESISYLRDRGITKDLCDLFVVMHGRDGEFAGVSIRNSLVVPIFDVDCAYKTFVVRRIDAQKSERWEFTSDSCAKRYLYGGWLANYTDRYLWIVEGVSDVWNLERHGVRSVGIFSSRASSYQLNGIHELCEKFNLSPVVCLDGDVSAGDITEVDLGVELRQELSAYGLDCKIVHLEKDEDPGNLTAERINFLRQRCYGEVT
jgi:hypothetical protein